MSAKKLDIVTTGEQGKYFDLQHARDAYGQTLHSPVDQNSMSYQELISLASKVYGRKLQYRIVLEFILKIATLFSKGAPGAFARICPPIFEILKFNKRFPEFRTKTFRQEIEQIKAAQEANRFLSTKPVP